MALPFCDPRPFDLSRETAAIEAARTAHPGLTSDLAAFAVSLLPADLFAVTGYTSQVGQAPAVYVRADGGELIIDEGASFAPAVLASMIMLELTDAVLVSAGTPGSAVPSALLEGEARVVGNTVASDTYIKLVGQRPDLARGPVWPRIPSWAGDRLRDHDRDTRRSFENWLLEPATEYLDVLVRYFGAEYYHPDPDEADRYEMRYPLDPADESALAVRMVCDE